MNFTLILTKDSKLCLINSRWGSRLTFNLNFSERSVETGGLGVDASHKKENPYLKQSLQQLKFYVKSGSSEEEGFYFSELPSYLASQELTIGMTYFSLKGFHSSELIVEMKIQSPICFAPNLEDDERIKMIHAPFFYIDASIENASNNLQKVDCFLGLDLIEIIHRGDEVIFYQDKGKNEIGKKSGELALKSDQKEGINYYSVNNDVFKGFRAIKELKPKEKLSLRFIYAGFVDDDVFLNEQDPSRKYKLKFYYTKWFKNLNEVLNYASITRETIEKQTILFESMLESLNAPPEKKELISIAFRSFLASAWLLISSAGTPEYYVWEGSFGMNSTVDVAMEVEVLAKLFPWTLKLQLKEWRKYLTINKKTGYLYLQHDMGLDQTVGESFYEKKSSMPVEENANFLILLYWYYHITKDKELLEELYHTAFNLATANKNRSYRNTGMAHIDTATTYDVSEVLHSAPLNTYLGIKELVAYLMCRELGKTCGDEANIGILQKEAEKIVDFSLYSKEKHGFLPVSLEPTVKGWKQRTIATSDPLFYVAMTKFKDPLLNKVVEILKSEFEETRRKCEFIYGIRLVENEEISWFSKIAAIEAVANLLYNIKIDSYKYAYDWNKNNPMAYCDGAFSEKKEWSGRRYPRGLSFMWELVYNYKK